MVSKGDGDEEERREGEIYIYIYIERERERKKEKERRKWRGRKEEKKGDEGATTWGNLCNVPPNEEAEKRKGKGRDHGPRKAKREERRLNLTGVKLTLVGSPCIQYGDFLIESG